MFVLYLIKKNKKQRTVSLTRFNLIKAILGKLPSYLCRPLSLSNSGYKSCPSTEVGKTAFSSPAPISWNSAQNSLQLQKHIFPKMH